MTTDLTPEQLAQLESDVTEWDGGFAVHGDGNIHLTALVHVKLWAPPPDAHDFRDHVDVITEEIDPHHCEELARMLNAVPALVAAAKERDELRSRLGHALAAAKDGADKIYSAAMAQIDELRAEVDRLQADRDLWIRDRDEATVERDAARQLADKREQERDEALDKVERAPLAALREAVHIVAERCDCGDNSCPFRVTSGMRTNSGCQMARQRIPGHHVSALGLLFRAARSLLGEDKVQPTEADVWRVEAERLRHLLREMIISAEQQPEPHPKHHREWLQRMVQEMEQAP